MGRYNMLKWKSSDADTICDYGETDYGLSAVGVGNVWIVSQVCGTFDDCIWLTDKIEV